MEIRVERYHIYLASHLLNVASSVWNSSEVVLTGRHRLRTGGGGKKVWSHP